MAVTSDTLWILQYKLNCNDRGFSFKAYCSGVAEGVARTHTTQIGLYLRHLLPTTAEIKYAAYSKDGPTRDARAVNAARGLGLYGTLETPAVETFADSAFTHLKLRTEHEGGNGPTRKIGPLPDGVVEDMELTTAVADVTFPVAGAITAPGAAAQTWFQRLTAFLQYLGTNTVHVKSGRIYGGAYDRQAWTAMMPWSIGKKKSGKAIVL